VLLAKNFGVKKIVNLTNIDYVYDKDPRKFKDAKKIEKISWKDFRKIVGDKWDPGLNVPFDPVASKDAEKLKLEVAIINGKSLDNFERYLNNEKFIGTVIK
jgi:uridylate kinase